MPSQDCQQVLTSKVSASCGSIASFDFRSPPVRQFGRLSALSSSKCSTYGVKALRRNIFTPLSTGATVRPVVAKLLSYNGLTSRKLHSVGAATQRCPAILWINSQVELSSLLNEENSFQDYHPTKDGVAASRVTTPSIVSRETEHN